MPSRLYSPALEQSILTPSWCRLYAHLKILIEYRALFCPVIWHIFLVFVTISSCMFFDGHHSQHQLLLTFCDFLDYFMFSSLILLSKQCGAYTIVKVHTRQSATKSSVAEQTQQPATKPPAVENTQQSATKPLAAEQTLICKFHGNFSLSLWSYILTYYH